MYQVKESRVGEGVFCHRPITTLLFSESSYKAAICASVSALGVEEQPSRIVRLRAQRRDTADNRAASRAVRGSSRQVAPRAPADNSALSAVR